MRKPAGRTLRIKDTHDADANLKNSVFEGVIQMNIRHHTEQDAKWSEDRVVGDVIDSSNCETMSGMDTHNRSENESYNSARGNLRGDRP
jgi:hypothetical protein